LRQAAAFRSVSLAMDELPEIDDKTWMEFGAWVVRVGGIERVKQMVALWRKPPRGATRDPQKSRERLAVALALEEGAELGEAIRRVVGRYKQDPNKYHELDMAFRNEATARYWRRVARGHKEAERLAREATFNPQELMRRKP
jgi:hypothetical protein